MQEKNHIQTLLSGCRNNDRKTQQIFYDYFKGYAVNICYRYSDNQQELDEIMSDGFMQVFKNIHLYNEKIYGSGEASFKGWLRRVLINVCVDFLRKKKKVYSFTSVEIESVNIMDRQPNSISKISHQEIIQAIHDLPVMYRTIFNLFVIEGFSHEEIAELMDIPVGTSKSTLSRAKEKLRIILNNKNNYTMYA